ncbi:MAG: hypothetical protein FWG30_05290 [Eubacteriaceae bacterium]|nr:hypothetical protein [Eubacteriaceae bacterium]
MAKIAMVIIDGMPNSKVDDISSYYPKGEPTKLFESSYYGWLTTTPQGLEPDTLNCVPTLLGVPKEQIPQGRAYCESLAVGISCAPSDLLLRCNPVRLRNGAIASANANGLSEEQYLSVSAAMQGYSSDFEMHHLQSYKNILILKGLASELPRVKTYPPHQNVGNNFESILPEGGPAGAMLASFATHSRKILSDALGDDIALMPWGQSAPCSLPSFYSIYGISASAVAGTEIVAGICEMMDMNLVYSDGFTGDTDTHLYEKALAAAGALEYTDFALMHINGADEAAHRLDQFEKAAFIQKIFDEAVMPLSKMLEPGSCLMVCSDHATDPISGSHKPYPQPFLLHRIGSSEHECLGEIKGTDSVWLLRSAAEGRLHSKAK